MLFEENTLVQLPNKFNHYSGNTIVSGSRDDTARLWNESSTGKWNPSTIYKGHTRYVITLQSFLALYVLVM